MNHALTSSIVPAGNLRWRVRGTVSPQLLRLLADPESFLRDPTLYFKNSKVVTISRVDAEAMGDGPRLVLRRLNYGKLRHQLRDLCRPSRVQRAFRNALWLEAAGIATARAVAATDVRRWRWPVAGYLVSEEIVNSQTLARYLAENSAVPRLLVRRLAELLAHLHESGFSHRDLKFTNILVDHDLRPYLIDLDGVSRMPPSSVRRAALDLGRLGRELHGRPDLLRRWGTRFLVFYCRRRAHPIFRPLSARLNSAQFREPKVPADA